MVNEKNYHSIKVQIFPADFADLRRSNFNFCDNLRDRRGKGAPSQYKN